MGSKQSKMEHKYIPGAPITQYGYVTRLNKNTISDSALDLRAPAECRTPFCLQNKDDTNLQLNVEGIPEVQPNSPNVLDALRKRLFKSFDPRSPNSNINRTPLIFDDTLEKSLHLDDTFADLFIESRLPKSLEKVDQCEENIDSECLENVGTDGLEKHITIDVEEQAEIPKSHVAVPPENDVLSANKHFDFDSKPEKNCQNLLSARCKRLFNCYVYDITDPRSPNPNINRTPLVFDDNLEKSLCLDNTSEDFIIEPDQTKKKEQSRESKCVEVAEMDLKKKIKTCNILIATQQVLDPRSPSLGVERTPIIFDDDEAEETNEDVMLESILENLKLNSNLMENNMISMAKSDMKVNTNIDSQFVTKPWNKRLDSLRSEIEYSPKAKHNKPKRLWQSRQQIYEDNENEMPITPKLKPSQSNKNNSLKGKRTPLSCVRNHNDTRGRSRSVESIKTRLALINIDDIGNPTEDLKFPALRIVGQGTLCSQGLMEL